MASDMDKLIAAILTTMCKRENTQPTVEQVILTYDRMLKQLVERDGQAES
jgi:hypothetical protein